MTRFKSVFLVIAILALALVPAFAQEQPKLEKVTYWLNLSDSVYNSSAKYEATLHFSNGSTQTLDGSYDVARDHFASHLARRLGVDTQNLTAAVQFVEQNPPDVAQVILGYAVWVVPSVFLLIVILANVFIVEQASERNIERFGRYLRTVKPGLRIKIPFIDSKGPVIPTLDQELPVEADTKTKDDTVLKVKLSIQYRVVDARAAQYEHNSPLKAMKSFAYDIVRGYVPDQELTHLYENKEQLALKVQELIGERMKRYGHEISSVQVVDFELPGSVQAAMNKVVEEQRLRQAAEQKGEAEKILVVKAAQAKKEQDKLHGEGIAAQREAIAKGYEESVKAVAEAGGIDKREASVFLLAMQYMDMAKDIGSNAKHVMFLPSGPNAAGDLIAQITAGLSAASAEHLPPAAKGANGDPRKGASA
ncbi:MAG TPA: SPFH domain-containing protein [Candidatus Paceibacterota bacterium]|nr:SPFH domain-containing protein [Candidatus Paceibacterota bacterium]